MRYFLSSMSSPYSKYLVAVTVDQTMIASEISPPARLLRSTKTEVSARNTKGIREYPRMLAVL